MLGFGVNGFRPSVLKGGLGRSMLGSELGPWGLGFRVSVEATV